MKLKRHAPSANPFYSNSSFSNMKIPLLWSIQIDQNTRRLSIKKICFDSWNFFIELPFIDVPVIYLEWIQSKVFKKC